MYVSRKIRLFPNNKQTSLLVECCNASRFGYNYAINKAKESYEKGEKWNDCTIRKSLTKDLNGGKFGFLREVSSLITKQAIKDSCKAHIRMFKGLSKRPRFKSRFDTKQSFHVDSYFIKVDGLKIKLPKFKYGGIRASEKILVENEKDMKNIRVTFDGLHWYLSYSYKVEKKNPTLNGGSLGIDVGVKTYATTSLADYVFKLPKGKLRILEKRRKRLQRKLSKFQVENKKLGLKRQKSKNLLKKQIKMRKTYLKFSNIVNDFIHKTTHDIVSKNFSRIVIEDLNIKGMLKNHKLSKAIVINSFNKFFNTLKYKCELSGIKLIKANRFYPSTQTCSSCGNTLKGENRLTLKDRVYSCKECGVSIDRDLNAAINLSRYCS